MEMEVNNNPLISVIIPMYNREKPIRYCLDSVVNQTYSKLEIIIVDDCSSDKSLEIVSTYRDDRLKIIKLAKNVGAQAARNRGIKEATADWIAFLDSDDEWFLDKIERQVKVLKEHGWNPFIVVHSDAILYDSINKIKGNFGIKKINGKCVFEELLISPAPLFQAILTSKVALESIGLLDECVPSYQEWDTSIRLAEKCEFVYLDEPTFIYYLHQGETISKNLMRDIEGYEYIIGKFEEKIRLYCGNKVWFHHIEVQYYKCLRWGFYAKAEYFLEKLPYNERFKIRACAMLKKIPRIYFFYKHTIKKLIRVIPLKLI
jgi:glycosyltransferase involved in cell wall biosynthesis